MSDLYNHIMASSDRRKKVIAAIVLSNREQQYASLPAVNVLPQQQQQQFSFIRNQELLVQEAENNKTEECIENHPTLQQTIYQQSYIYYTIFYEEKSYITQDLVTNSKINKFDNNNFEYFFGSKSYYPQSRSCAVSKQVIAFLGQANDSSQGPIQEISQFEMFLLPIQKLQLNFLMASQKDFIYNLERQLNYLFLQIQYQISTYKSYQVLLLLLIQKQAKMTNMLVIEQLLLHHFAIGIYTRKNCIMNQSLICQQTKRSIQFGVLKVYYGGLIQECDYCGLKINNQDCLFCKSSNNYLQQGQYFTCNQSCDYPFNNLSDSISLTCSFISQGTCDEKTGLDKFFSTNCSCPKSQYFDMQQNLCLNCLNYCDSFQNGNSCFPNHPNSYKVIGIQSPLFPNSNHLCGSIGQNNWIIKGDFILRYFADFLYSFSEEDLQIVADFNFLDYQDNFEKNQFFVINKMDSSISFTIQPMPLIGSYLFDNYKEFQFQNSQGIINLNQNLYKAPFVIKITISPDTFLICYAHNFQFLKLISKNNVILSFKIVSNSFNYQYQIEVCLFDGSCKKFTKANLFYQSPNILISYNFFIIQYRNEQLGQWKMKAFLLQKIISYKIGYAFYINFNCPSYSFLFCIKVLKVQFLQFSDQTTSIKLNALINYILDEVELQTPYNFNFPQFYDIMLGNQINSYPDINLFYSGLQNFTCIYPKQGYALKNGVLISPNDCNKNIQLNQPLYYYNKYTMMCQNSGITLPYCLNIDISNKKCTQCIDSQMDLQNNCSCPNGMFLEKYSLMCRKCSSQCKSCSIKEDNCLLCQGNNKTPPSCDCSLPNYYQDTNQNCQECASQYKSCSQNQSFCLSCSEGRINPPLCYCNPILYTNSYSDPITNECKKKNCPYKCLVCDHNNQCFQCRGDRALPYCLCQQGYYDDPFNQLEFCQKCEIGLNFDENQQRCIGVQCYANIIFESLQILVYIGHQSDG
ncbi:hypothetical protein ABPG72_008491 [Tetrahymena utriculariae]